MDSAATEDWEPGVLINKQRKHREANPVRPPTEQ
jgi:hypothetical protein